VLSTIRDAYHAATARKRLRAPVSWLENNGHEDAAASLAKA
jgi:hypothetical protein